MMIVAEEVVQTWLGHGVFVRDVTLRHSGSCFSPGRWQEHWSSSSLTHSSYDRADTGFKMSQTLQITSCDLNPRNPMQLGQAPGQKNMYVQTASEGTHTVPRRP